MTSIGKGDAGHSDPRMLNQNPRDMLGGRNGSMGNRDEFGQVDKDPRMSPDARQSAAAMSARSAAFQRSIHTALHDDPAQQDALLREQAAMVLLASTNSVVTTDAAPAPLQAAIPPYLHDIVSQIQVLMERQAIAPVGPIGTIQRFELQLKLNAGSSADLHGIRVSIVDGSLDVILMHGGDAPSAALSEAARDLIETLRQKFPQRPVRVLGSRDGTADQEVVADGFAAISQLLAGRRTAS